MALNIQASLAGFRESLITAVQQTHLSDPNHLSDHTKDLWTSTTITWPRILPANEVWMVNPPSITKLILGTLDAIDAAKAGPSAFTVYRRGEADVKTDPRLAVTQLMEPKESDPMTIIGLEILPDDALGVPLALSEFADAYDVSNQQLLLTPKYAHTDLHLDSADGISMPVGPCTKLWLCFPPTEKNIDLMAKADGQKAKLVRIGKKLEGGIIYQTTSANAIYLPAGTLHSVFTIRGGFLASVDFITPRSSLPLSSLLAGDIDQLAPGSFRKELFARYLASVELGLDNKTESLAISSWIKAFERIIEYAKTNEEWRAKGVQMWRDWFGTMGSKKITCPCGNQGAETLKRHLWTAHSSVGQGRVVVGVEDAPVGRPQTRALKRKADEGDENVKAAKRAKT